MGIGTKIRFLSLILITNGRKICFFQNSAQINTKYVLNFLDKINVLKSLINTNNFTKQLFQYQKSSILTISCLK